MSTPSSIRARLARPFDTAELRRIKRLWVRHSIAEDARDIFVSQSSDQLIAEAIVDTMAEQKDSGKFLLVTSVATAPVGS